MARGPPSGTSRGVITSIPPRAASQTSSSGLSSRLLTPSVLRGIVSSTSTATRRVHGRVQVLCTSPRKDYLRPDRNPVDVDDVGSAFALPQNGALHEQH